MCLKNNTQELKKQDYIGLEDIKNGHVSDWKGKKMASSELAESYKRLGLTRKYGLVKFCGDYLEFRANPEDLAMKKLFRANFCKVRLCPMCAWRRSLKIFNQLSAVMNEIDNLGEYKYIFLTLTVKNIKGAELSETLDKMFKGFNLLTKRKEFKKAIKGHFRALEITHNTNKYSKSYDTYHPHFHCILQVNKSYFTSRYFINKTKWVELWQECMRLDYAPSVDIRKADKSAVPEVAKYTVKDKDYIVKYDNSLTDSAVLTLDTALHGRRLCAFGGMMKEIHKKLNLDDADNGDLILTDSEKVNEELLSILVRYRWNVGVQDYVLEEVREAEKTEL